MNRQRSLLELEDSPQSVRLYGPPGAGKTTYLRHLVYNWSTKFLNSTQSSDCINGDLDTTMVYLPAASIKTTVEEAIKDQLRCKEKHVEVLVSHVQKGEGVAIVIDGLDEIRDKSVLENVEKYVHDRKHRGGPQVLIAARTDLCKINSLEFDRLLYLQGFSSSQGIEYAKLYFSAQSNPRTQQQTVLEYLEKHMKELEWLLHNPLRLHIFCALTAKGYLQLSDDNLLSSLNLFDKLELFLLTRECEKTGLGKVTDQESQDFYKMCLFAILTGKREFPESLLVKFNVVRQYLVFMERQDVVDEHAEYTTCYSFRHEVLYEYFASRCIQKLPRPLLKSLLLSTCSQRSLRNVQKIMMQMILKQNLLSEELVKSMIQSILVFQNQNRTSENQILDDLLEIYPKGGSLTCVEEVLLSAGDEQQIGQVDAAWQAINKAFIEHADKLRKTAWFHDLEDEGTIGHVVDCLKACTPTQQEHITKETLLRLLPCVYVRFE